MLTLPIPDEARFRISGEIWDEIVASGALRGQRVELIDGVITTMSPENARHAWVVTELTAALASRLPPTSRLRVQHPLRLSGTRQPEPDLAVVDAALPRHAHPSTALLVIEVSDSSLRYDRAVKVPMYAEAQIPELWIVNLADALVEVYREPDGSQYRSVSLVRPGEGLASLAFPEIGIDVAELLA